MNRTFVHLNTFDKDWQKEKFTDDILREENIMKKKKSLYNKLKEGLEEAIAHEKGEKKLKTTYILIDPLPVIKGKEIKKIRNYLNLTQGLFAEVFGVSRKTVEAWESGINIPNGPSQRILNALKKNPSLLSNFGWAVMEK